MDKDLNLLVGDLRNSMDHNPSGEKPLKALIDIEEALRSNLEIKEMSADAKMQIDNVLMEVCGQTIPGFLDEISERVIRAMDSGYLDLKEDLEMYLQKLKIVYRKIERVILYSDERNGIMLGSGSGVEKKELYINKLQYLLELLRDNEIYTDDICVIAGENLPEMMREESYLCIEIPKVKRTVLLNMGYGEASFVLYDIYNRDMLFDMTKERIQFELGATKVICSENDIVKWKGEMAIALRLHEADFQQKINMKEYDEKIFYIGEIKKLYPTAEEFMGLTFIQKSAFKINGKGLSWLTTKIAGKSGLTPANIIGHMAVLAKCVYGEGHEVIEDALKELETDSWGRERWIEEVKKKYPTAEEFMYLSLPQRKALDINGKKLAWLTTKIAGKSGLNPAKIIGHMAVLAKCVYGEGHEVIEDALKELETDSWGRERWIEEVKKKYPTAGDFMELNLDERLAFNIQGKGFCALAKKIIEKKGFYLGCTAKDMAILAKCIYGEGHKVIEDALNEAETESWGRERWIEEIRKKYPLTYEEFIKLDLEQRRALKINGKGLTFIATKITGKNRLNPFHTQRDMVILAEAIYGTLGDSIAKE